MIADNITESATEMDTAETMLHTVDEKVKSTAGISLFHILTAAAIVSSVILFLRGNKLGAIFVGLWPPTFQALKSASKGKE
jgi:predicted phage tail protein